MFTGIVQSQAEIISLTRQDEFVQIIVKGELVLTENLLLGASIAINGTCLTVVAFKPVNGFSHITFDVIDETLRLTNLDCLCVGDKVNVERSLKMGDELGGHIVSGHVHHVGQVVERRQTDANCSLKIAISSEWEKYILPKGFITVNGVSLTVGTVDNNHFSLHLIPETLARTNLGLVQVGDKVNLEYDQQTMTIVTTIERLKLKLA